MNTFVMIGAYLTEDEYDIHESEINIHGLKMSMFDGEDIFVGKVIHFIKSSRKFLIDFKELEKIRDDLRLFFTSHELYGKDIQLYTKTSDWSINEYFCG